MVSRSSCCHHSTIWSLSLSQVLDFPLTEKIEQWLLLLLLTIKVFLKFISHLRTNSIKSIFQTLTLKPCESARRCVVIKRDSICFFSEGLQLFLHNSGVKNTSEISSLFDRWMNRSKSIVVSGHLVHLTCWSQCVCPSFRTSRTTHEGTTSPLTAGSAPSGLRGSAPPVGQQVASSEV